ncbi:hypothetical protein O4160_08525 [Rhodococcus sp. IEGM 1401]|uniref:hypothetical protein n=1 Tax=unclassified Rhodococcus (in: high G+C Gram-positive bacteria) TaxID=192944 RepID=UPI0022B395DD|nr:MULTISPECIES: hypothetical protein [unclassified Rhodococcus (in: high G+C Gram-positive bacteria)]MCZ4560886.1 hypothetical protein [Rhodococcus sp. IEGM 1401]MDI9921027.1 hypothetical protein [Rhodococcus sp. IEGM 1372]MDV8033373.1 hypothetical protein [Rhodococcus sp. IEGM 1414]
MKTRELSPRVTTGVYVGCGVVTGIAVFAKADLIGSLLPLPGPILLVVLIAACLLPFFHRYFLRFSRWLGPLTIFAVLVMVAVVQPRLASLRGEGRGSDQGECLAVGVDRMFAGQWPYDSSQMSTGNAMSCGPGWLVAHAPVALIGYPLTMSLLIGVCLLVIGRIVGMPTLNRFMVLLALTPGFWLSLANGNDFLTFGFALAALIALTLSDSKFAVWILVPATIVVSQFRFPFLTLGLPIFFRRGSRGSSMLLAAISASISLIWWFGYMIWDSRSFTYDGPMHVYFKLNRMVGGNFDMAVFVGIFVVASVVVAYVATSFGFPGSLLVYCGIFVVPLSALNIVEVWRAHPNLLDTIQFWEGTSWMTAMVCLAGFLVALSTGPDLPESARNPSQSRAPVAP